MSVRHVTWLKCDLCGAKSANGADEMDAQRRAVRLGWRLLQLHYAGTYGHVCKRCAVGKTDDALLDLLMRGE